MDKKRYILPDLTTVDLNMLEMIASTNEVDGDHIKTDDGSMDEGDGDDAAAKGRTGGWGDLWSDF